MHTYISLATVFSACVGVVLPLLVGLVTKEVHSSNIKAILLALLTGISGFLSEWLVALNGGTAFQWQTALFTWLLTFIVAVGTHYGFLKPVGATAKVQAIGDKQARDPETGRFVKED